LGELAAKIKALDVACEQALAEPDNLDLKVGLIVRLRTGKTPLVVPTGHGERLDKLIDSAAGEAHQIKRSLALSLVSYVEALQALRRSLLNVLVLIDHVRAGAA
jgi:hypothetical protein